MKVKVFYPNREGKIEFTRQELEKLLDEVYREGQKDCNCNKTWTWGTRTTPYHNGSLISDSTSNATTATTTTTIANPDLSTAIYATDNNVNDDSKAVTIKSNNKEAKPYSITMKINEADVNKAAEAFKAMLDYKDATTSQKIEDVFSGLAKELNF